MKKNIFFLLLISFNIYANDSREIEFLDSDVKVNIAAGKLTAKSTSKFYDTLGHGNKYAQSEFKIKNMAILKGNASVNVTDYLTLNVRGWTSIASGVGGGERHWWLDENQSGWTDYLSLPDTKINDAHEYDLNANLWLIERRSYKIGGVAGYQKTHFSWTSKGGYFNYDKGTDIGTLPQTSSVGLRQDYSMPYIGLIGYYRVNNFEFSAIFKFSDWVNIRYNEEDYLEGYTYRTNSSNSRYYGTSFDAGFYITPKAKIVYNFAFNNYKQGKGGIKAIDRIYGGVFYAGGEHNRTEHKNYMHTAGFEYNF